ncbi:hypothetical protein B0H10DRAFT_2073036 [Mycena sp. CBHHK59/15]|nr:hypothetical protein B0H10DRAFT_2073036 [Mycena sp. CBHHK59/15]
MQHEHERLPTFTARIGQACYKCFKGEDVRLSRCTGCHLVAYCSTGRSSGTFADWRKHKPICKALSGIENDNAGLVAATLLFSVTDTPTTDLNYLHNQTEAYGSNVMMFCERTLGRPFTTYSDLIIRIEAARNPGVPARQHLSPCPDCNMAFYCSPAHWDVARALHCAPCEDGHDGLSHCEMNREVRADTKFEDVMAGANAGEFMWAPERVKPEWASLKGSTWETEFADELRSFVRVPTSLPIGPWIRGASNTLTMPMTILYALEQLNETDAWASQNTLTVHILGAAQIEISGAMVFEEILHRLPAVKTLKLVLCGPELDPSIHNKVIPMETCPDCTRRGRKRIHQHIADTYHSFIQKQGSKFEKPDLAIAFNSGSSQESTATWPATFKALVQKNIPSILTAYNREEAEAEAKLLSAAGANLRPSLGPRKNPWGSSKVIPEPNKVYGFYAVNGWLAGGFR